MDLEEISGISEEFDEVLEQVESGELPEVNRKKDSENVLESEEPLGKAVPSDLEDGKSIKKKIKSAEESSEKRSRRRIDEAKTESARGKRLERETEKEPEKEPQKEPEKERKKAPKKRQVKRRVRKVKVSESSYGLLHPSDGLIAAFFIPVIIMVVIFAQRGIFPFGQESFLRTDMYHQYAPFFSEFQYKLRNGGSLLYSWDIGMGVNFAALYAYYLASPSNWLLILCPKEYIIEFMTYSVVIKIGLSGLAFAYYLKQHNKTSDFGVGFFGIFYALSGYMAAYSWNIMWLDCILLFPLIMLGLEQLVKEKKGTLYCITLGLSILSNYYISIMICIFMVLYYISLLILEKKRGFKELFISFLQFSAYSLIAGALAAIVLIPEIAALQATASGDFSFPKTFESYFPIFDMLARHIGNVETEIGLGHWPNIYCGVAVYLFFCLYLVCNKIPVREKVVYCFLLLIFLASFSINVLNFVWHGFHYPNSLPCRQSFIYIFLMLSVCYRAYMYLDETPKKHIAAAFWLSVGFILLAQKLITDEAYHFVVFYMAIVFLAFYLGLIYFYKNPKHSRATAVLLTLGVVAVEAAANTAVTSISTTSRTSYKEHNKEALELTKGLTSEHGFYRIEMVERKTKNDGAWMNFPSVSLFSSVANADVTEFFRKIGCEGSTNAYSITGSTPLVDSLLSVKYALYQGSQENPNLLLNRFSDPIYLYENPCTLPLGYMLPEELVENWKLDMPNPVNVQNDMANILNAPKVLAEILGEENGTSFSFVPDEDGEYYVYVLNKRVKSVSVSKGENVTNFDNIGRGYLLEIGYCKANETVTVENRDDSEELNARAYLFEPEGLRTIYECLNRQPLILTKWEEDQLEGTVEVKEAGTLFLSIPYDKGWRIFVDGTERTPKKVFDTFLGLELTEGHHQIRLEYQPKGLKEGVLISFSAVILLLLGFLAENLIKKKRGGKTTPYNKLDEEWHDGKNHWHES